MTRIHRESVESNNLAPIIIVVAIISILIDILISGLGLRRRKALLALAMTTKQFRWRILQPTLWQLLSFTRLSTNRY